MRRFGVVGLAAVVVAALVGTSTGAALGGGYFTNITQDGNGFSGDQSVSGDGSVVAFESDASTLTPGDTNGQSDVFVWERATGALTNITQDGNGFSGDQSVSEDGSVVTFRSTASNLTPNFPNGVGNVFVWERATGDLTNITQDGNRSSFDSSVSGDGSVVAFSSSASNLTPGDINDATDVFVWERATGEFTNITQDGKGSSNAPSVSGDGSVVAFSSGASNLTPGDTNGRRDVFVWERARPKSVLTNITQNGNGRSLDPSVSADGSLVAFPSDASNLTPNDNNNVFDVFVWERATGDFTNITQDGNSDSFSPSVSGDGSVVAFHSFASNLTPDDTNGHIDAFVWKRPRPGPFSALTNITEAGNGNSAAPSVSGDGSVVAFQSAASNLTPGDTNGQRDVFVWEVDDTSPVVTFPQPTVFIDTRSPQTVAGTVTDVGSGVARVEIIALDLGAAGATGVTGLRAWTAAGVWAPVADAPVLTADVVGGAWSFTWDPVPGGSGSYVIGIRAFDNAGNKWPPDKDWQALVVIADTTKPTITAETPTVAGNDITWSGTASDNVTVRKVRLIIRHFQTNEYWNGTTWVPSAQAAADPAVLLHADLSNPLSSNTDWSYTLNTDRTGAFQTLHWAQNGAYGYSIPVPGVAAK